MDYIILFTIVVGGLCLLNKLLKTYEVDEPVATVGAKGGKATISDTNKSKKAKSKTKNKSVEKVVEDEVLYPGA